MRDKAVLVIGAGDATGGAIARRFAREGYVACVTRRHADKLAPLVAAIEAEGGRARAFGSDARKEDEIVALVDTIENEVGPIEIAVYNIGANVNFTIRLAASRPIRKPPKHAISQTLKNTRAVVSRIGKFTLAPIL